MDGVYAAMRGGGQHGVPMEPERSPPDMAWVLRATDVFGPTRWRWLLEDAGGRAVADHEVDLTPMSVTYEVFCDLDGYLRRNACAVPKLVTSVVSCGFNDST